MKIHTLKLNENFWHAVLCGDKNFEVRNNDRGFQKGDEVRFTLVNDAGEIQKPLSPWFVITYVLSGWGIKEGFVVFGIKRKG